MTTKPTLTDLKRGLDRRQMEMIAIGGCIGTGLFMGSGKSISLAGPAIILVYAVTGLMLYFVMRAMGELLLHDLRYKSFVDFTEDLLGPQAGYFVGWSYWFAWIVAAIAEIIAITGYVGFWWPDVPPWLTATVTVGILLTINLLAVGIFGELEFWLAIVKVVAIISLILLGCWLTVTGFHTPEGVPAQISNLWDHGGIFPHGVDGILAALQTTIFAFAGMEIIGTMNAEAKDPEKTLPDAIHKIPWRILLFYIGTVTVLMIVTPWVDISPDQSPFVGLFSLVGLAAAASIVNFVVTSSATSSSNSGIFATSRMLYGLAHTHNAPAVFGRLSQHHVPTGGVFLATALMLLVSVLLTVTSSMMEAFQMVGSVAALLFIFIWTMILAAHIAYRKKFPQKHISAAFPMPHSRTMTVFVLLFFAVVIYALSLEDVTRIALYILPVWFSLLALVYRIKQRKVKLSVE